MVSKEKGFFVCTECKLKYAEKVWAEKCEEWCKMHPTCNAEILRHAFTGDKE